QETERIHHAYQIPRRKERKKENDSVSQEQTQINQHDKVHDQRISHGTPENLTEQ
ncbi:hypothetical protein BaRGS_00005114, partial [Batillaria attramentaria]